MLAQMVKISSVLTFEIENDAVMSATHEPVNEKFDSQRLFLALRPQPTH